MSRVSDSTRRASAQEIDAGGIGPVQILQRQQQRLPRRRGREGLPELLRRRARAGRRGDGPVAGRQARARVEPGTVRRRDAKIVAPSDRHADAARLRRGRQRADQGGFADARFARDQEKADLAGGRGRDELAAPPMLTFPARRRGRAGDRDGRLDRRHGERLARSGAKKELFPGSY
jgi:hypothetical protein